MKTEVKSAQGNGPGDEESFTRGAGIHGRVALGLFGLLALIGGFGGWAATSELSGAVIGQGQVKVDQDIRAIQHLDGGVLRSIDVKKGDLVKANQVLLSLDDTVLKSDMAIDQGQLVELMAKRQRLIAERDGETTMPARLENDSLRVADSPEYANEVRLFNGNRQTRADQIAQLQHSIEQIEGTLSGLKSQKLTNARELALVQTELDKFKALKKQGLVEGSRVYGHERDVARLNGEVGQLEANVIRETAHKRELEGQLAAIDNTARTDAQKQLADVEPRIAELSERIRAISAKLGRLEIRSPIAGTVNEVSVNTIGGVITPAQKLLTIVPQDAALQVEARIQLTDIDQIYLSQVAKLRFTAFNSRETPELSGTVTFISPASTVESSTGRAFYLAQVDVPRDQMIKLNGKKLVPGMPVEVFAQTESRTALSYLTKPFLDQFRRAFREN